MRGFDPFRASLLLVFRRLSEMNFESVVACLNRLLLRDQPKSFSSTWILKHAPSCYRFIRTKVRAEVGGIDWDRVTFALDRKYQRLWVPRRRRKSDYRDVNEIDVVLNKHRDKLYVFIAPRDASDRHLRNVLAIALVRVAQGGNLSAKEEVVDLLRYTIDEWLDRHHCLSCWKGRDDQIRVQLEGCIRRYRYTGSFLNYVFRTLEYAGRGMHPLYAYSLDEPVSIGSNKRKIGNVT